MFGEPSVSNREGCPAHDSGGEIVFRKPRMLGWWSLHTPAGRLKGLLSGFLVLIALSPLFRGINELRYTVRISPDVLTIADRAAKRVAAQPLRIDE
jgi:hypothetical protein